MNKISIKIPAIVLLIALVLSSIAFAKGTSEKSFIDTLTPKKIAGLEVEEGFKIKKGDSENGVTIVESSRVFKLYDSVKNKYFLELVKSDFSIDKEDEYEEIEWCVSPFYNGNACVHLSNGQIIGFVSKNGEFNPYDGDFRIIYSKYISDTTNENIVKTEHRDEDNDVDGYCYYTKDGKEIVKIEETRSEDAIYALQSRNYAYVLDRATKHENPILLLPDGTMYEFQDVKKDL